MNEILIIFNLFILETLLSIDNAAVLAMMVRDLPPAQQPKALKYGMIGAFLFRGICLFTASYLIKFTFLKIIGGAFLMYLFLKHFLMKDDPDSPPTNYHWGKLSVFWSTVIMVELMDLVFSIDNVFAAVAITDNIFLILIGVFVGIISMRFIAQSFTKVIQKYPEMTNAAFIVIMLLGMRLIICGILDYTSNYQAQDFYKSHAFELIFSLSMLVIFCLPVVFRTKR